jgi:hypothetical protein
MITFTFMSLITSVKDYVEITHKLIEIEPLKNYTEFGSVFTYFLFSLGDFLKNFFSFSLFKNIWSIPIIIPDISSAMISEVSVLDSYFHNAFTFLETNVNTATNPTLVIFEKFMIGLINSIFLILPTSTSHLITLRRFVMQGLDAGYIAGLGTLAGNFLWLSSIILGWRFFIIPWLSLDIFRYLLGFILLVKYIWDSSKERRMALEDLSKWKIFLLNFLLTLTEQSCIYPFISNLSIGSDTSILEGFPTATSLQFFTVHGAYLFGILLGSFSLLQFTCWFWENPAFSIYLWITTKSSLKISTSSYYKILNFTFLYATMLCAIASIPYYGLDYTITNPIGLVPQDRILDQKKSQSDPDKLITETAFLGVNSTDKNSRIRDGVHARRERWKQRLIKYQAYDAALYDQGLYDFLTIEDLNYGFDRFWLRRKMRNHQIRFRLFPGPWMRSLKKQLNNPANQTVENTNKAASGSKKKVEFFRILFEQFYHPNFHDRNKIKLTNKKGETLNTQISAEISKATRISTGQVNLNSKPLNNNINLVRQIPDGLENTLLKKLETKFNLKQGLIYSNSALRKFVRNVNTRINLKLLNNQKNNITNKYQSKFIYSKRWKFIFSKIQPLTKTKNRNSYQLFRTVAKQLLLTPEAKSLKLTTINQKLSPKERKLLNLQTHYIPLINKHNDYQEVIASQTSRLNNGKFILLRPLNVYLQKEQAFKRKLRYYGSTPIRKLTVGNQAPFFKALMKRGFYYYKPSLRWKKTLYIASMRRGFRKKSRKPRVLVMSTLQKSDVNPLINKVSKQQLIKGDGENNYSILTLGIENNKSMTVPADILDDTSFNTQTVVTSNNNLTEIIQPTHSYNVLGKRASRYRHQIYKDVLQHWYYTPFNRLLLKFDIDAFINRQPKSHFLTKNEERILHIRRFLLAEHYDTLRWYTSMQHYKTMKTNIGGTKSFANRTYNQQFQGTFKKIRHLFAITPKQGDFYTLKFDQPLYNDNKLKDNVYYHEELLTDTNALNMNNLKTNNVKSNSTNNSFVIMPKNVVQQTQISEESTSNLNIPNSHVSKENNNWMSSTSTQLNSNISSQNLDIQKQVTYKTENFDFIKKFVSFLIGNQFLNLSTLENTKQDNASNQYLPCPKGHLCTNGPVSTILQTKFSKENYDFIYSELFVKLIKECKKRLYDQAFLKNYITHRIEKREQLNQEQTKELNKRLEKLKTWLNSEQKTTIQQPLKTTTVLTTGLQKAVNDSLSSMALPPSMPERTWSYTNSSIDSYGSKSTYNELNYAYTIRTEDEILNKFNLINQLTNGKIAEGENKKQEKNKSTKYEKNLNLENTKLLLYNIIYKFKPILFNQTQFLKMRTNKNLEWWRKKQRVITKRKNARKRDRFKKQIATVNKKLAALSKKVETEKSNLYKTLYGHYEISDYLLTNVQNTPKITDSTLLRKKQDNSFDKQKMPFSNESLGSVSNVSNKKLWQNFFNTKFRKKASSKGRRYRLLSLARYLTATRKPRLGGFEDLIKIDNISNKTGSFLTKEEKEERLNVLLNNNYNLMDSLKKAQIKKRSRHSWKKRARHLFSRNHYKYRKRHIHGNGKLRVMNKKLKKIKSTNELKQWWWASFLPRYLNNLETISFDKSSSTTDLTSNLNNISLKNLNNFAFKPLSNYKAIITSPDTNLQTSSGILPSSHNYFSGHKESSLTSINIFDTYSPDNHSLGSPSMALPPSMPEPTSSRSISSSDKALNLNNDMNLQSVNLTTTSLPFYAGWDESLRKFVVTNRLLSRRDSGLTVKETISTTQKEKSQEILFTNTPIEGLNEGSFLYWQTDMPFNSYNIDQFITTNQSFYAPLGWRRFELRHSILKTWVNYSNYLQISDQYLPQSNNQKYALDHSHSKVFHLNLYAQTGMDRASLMRDTLSSIQRIEDPPMEYLVSEILDQAQIHKNKPLIISMKNLSASINNMDSPMEHFASEKLDRASLRDTPINIIDPKQEKIYMKKGIARRIKKRYKLLKQTPNQLMYSPTGPLLTDVLPSHYISVFDQQYRFPRNRYLKRNTLKTLKKTTLLADISLSSNQTVGINKEFTLRKRVKPRRKYHRKRFIKKDGLIFPRRTKFIITSSEDSQSINNLKLSSQTDLRWRPSSKTKQKRKESLRSKIKSNKRVKTNPLRLRQLRRREFQQILKPIQRYIPRNGGFTWPGDYLRLEVVEMPKLKTVNSKKTSLKQKINVQPVGIMPRRYLIEKHNINVLKKKLEKAYSSHQFSKTVKEYKNLIQN